MNVEALQARAVELVNRQAGTRRQQAALAAALAVGFCVGLFVDVGVAPLAIGAAVLGGIAFKLAR